MTKDIIHEINLEMLSENIIYVIFHMDRTTLMKYIWSFL